MLPSECNLRKVLFTLVFRTSKHLSRRRRRAQSRVLSWLFQTDFSIVWSQPPYCRQNIFTPWTKVVFVSSQPSHLEVDPIPACKKEKLSWVQSRIESQPHQRKVFLTQAFSSSLPFGFLSRKGLNINPFRTWWTHMKLDSRRTVERRKNMLVFPLSARASE